MKRQFFTILLALAAVAGQAQKVVLHMANKKTIEYHVSQLDSISFEKTEEPAPEVKVRVALYETIPGYDVKDVVFYTDTTENSKRQTSFTLFATDNQSPFTIEFGTLSSNLLGTTATSATFAGNADDKYYIACMPDEAGTDLTLRTDFTLVASDGSGEIIHVPTIIAQVPAMYTRWDSGHTYTYTFKIIEHDTVWTGTTPKLSELFSIALDSVIVDWGTDNMPIITITQ